MTGAKGKTMKIGVVGLGSMGYGIAASLLRAGHAVCGADMNAAAVARLQAAGGMAEGIAQAAPGLDALAVVVLNAAQVEAVLFGPEGLAPALPRGAVVCGGGHSGSGRPATGLASTVAG